MAVVNCWNCGCVRNAEAPVCPECGARGDDDPGHYQAQAHHSDIVVQALDELYGGRRVEVARERAGTPLDDLAKLEAETLAASIYCLLAERQFNQLMERDYRAGREGLAADTCATRDRVLELFGVYCRLRAAFHSCVEEVGLAPRGQTARARRALVRPLFPGVDYAHTLMWEYEKASDLDELVDILFDRASAPARPSRIGNYYIY